jgi:hypothetical protein
MEPRDRAAENNVPEAASVSLAGVSETALITLYNRGTEAQRPGGLIDDPLALALSRDTAPGGDLLVRPHVAGFRAPSVRLDHAGFD